MFSLEIPLMIIQPIIFLQTWIFFFIYEARASVHYNIYTSITKYV